MTCFSSGIANHASTHNVLHEWMLIQIIDYIKGAMVWETASSTF